MLKFPRNMRVCSKSIILHGLEVSARLHIPEFTCDVNNCCPDDAWCNASFHYDVACYEATTAGLLCYWPLWHSTATYTFDDHSQTWKSKVMDVKILNNEVIIKVSATLQTHDSGLILHCVILLKLRFEHEDISILKITSTGEDQLV